MVSNLSQEIQLVQAKTTAVSTFSLQPFYIYYYIVGADEQNVVKIRGLQYNIRYEEVADFFKDFKIVQQSVVLGVNYEGRKNGFGAILFETEDEAAAAQKALHKQYIGPRYVDLSIISYNEYKNFNNRGGNTSGGGGGNYGGQHGSYVKLQNCVNSDNQERSLVIRGLPYKVTKDVIQDFLSGYGKIPEESIFIEEFNGKRTGSALVVFENDTVAQDAKAKLQKQEIEGRYIELFDQNDEFMRKICKLN